MPQTRSRPAARDFHGLASAKCGVGPRRCLLTLAFCTATADPKQRRNLNYCFNKSLPSCNTPLGECKYNGRKGLCKQTAAVRTFFQSSLGTRSELPQPSALARKKSFDTTPPKFLPAADRSLDFMPNFFCPPKNRRRNAKKAYYKEKCTLEFLLLFSRIPPLRLFPGPLEQIEKIQHVLGVKEFAVVK